MSARNDKAAELREGLAHCHGGDTVYRHPLFRGFKYTQGVQYLAETAGAYWLLDLVFSHQRTQSVAREPFQTWTLTVDLTKHEGLVVATDGGKNGRKPREIARQLIEYTDFPLDEIKLFLEGDVLLLPSEH